MLARLNKFGKLKPAGAHGASGLRNRPRPSRKANTISTRQFVTLTLDGLEVCTRLKSKPATQAISVVFVTAVSRDTERLAAFEAGADDYVVKPTNHEELVFRIQRARTLKQCLSQRDEDLEQRLERTLNWLDEAGALDDAPAPARLLDKSRAELRSVLEHLRDFRHQTE